MELCVDIPVGCELLAIRQLSYRRVFSPTLYLAVVYSSTLHSTVPAWHLLSPTLYCGIVQYCRQQKDLCRPGLCYVYGLLHRDIMSVAGFFCVVR